MGVFRILMWLWRSRLLRRGLRFMVRVLRYIGWRRVARAVLRLSRRRRPAGRFRLTHARGR